MQLVFGSVCWVGAFIMQLVWYFEFCRSSHAASVCIQLWFMIGGCLLATPHAPGCKTEDMSDVI